MTNILNLFPETPVRETWNWLTDIMSTKNGTESRLSLRPTPRTTMTLSWAGIDQTERNTFVELIARDLMLPSTVPVWPFAARVTALASSGATKVFFDPVRAQISDGGRIVFFNPYTRVAIEGVVTTMDADGANLSAPLGIDITTDFFTIKGITGLLANGQGFRWDAMAGSVSAQVSSWIENDVIRTNNAVTLTTLDSLPILERTFQAGVDENYTFPREVDDNKTGLRTISSRYLRANISGTRKFRVERGYGNEADYDYWTVLMDWCRGSWKPFLISSQLADMTLDTALSQGGTTMVINETYSDELFHAFTAYTHFEILYTDGTKSSHTITNSVDGGGTVIVTFSPALPVDPKVANVTRISYLLKARMSDQISWRHYPLESEVSFDIITTDNG